MMRPVPAFVAIMVVLAGGIGYYGIHLPKEHEVRVIQTQIAEERASQGTQEEVAALLAQIERYRHRLPTDADPSWLAQEVVSVAQKLDVQLTSITQEPPQQLDRYTRLAVNLQLTASYHQLGAFLDEIERSPRFIHVDRLSVDRSDGDEKGLILVTLSTVVVPPIISGNSGS